MKKVLFAIVATFLFSGYCFTQNLTNKKWSVTVAQSFIKRFSDPDTMYCCGNTNHFSWQAGYLMFAMEKIWKSTGDSTYFSYIKKYVDQQVDEKGNVPPFKDDALDNFLPGYAILFMYEQTGEEKYKIAAQTIRKGFDKYPRNSDGLFWHGEWATNQSWIDGVFMGQIFLARYGSVIGDKDYAYSEVVKQMTLIVGHCGKENGLILHGWDESKKARWADKNTGLAPEVWSEGLGWYAVLMADIFDYLPKDQPGYARLVEIHKNLCEGIKNNQDTATGMWCQVVDKCGHPGNWNETSGTGMYIYLIQKSIDKGLINTAEYGPVIEKAYKGMIKKAVYNQDGFIDLMDCSSIGIEASYDEYINSPKEVSPFAAFGSFIISTNIIENKHSMNTKSNLERINIESNKREILWQDANLIEAPNWLAHDKFIINEKGKMYRIDLSKNEKQEIFTGRVQNCNNDHGISPDGKSLVISSHDPDSKNPEAWKTSKIYILPIQGGEPRLITEKDCSFWHGWSPDGQRIAYTANRNNKWDIYSISVKGGVEKQLTTAPGHADGADYSPDGNYIYYNAYSSGSMEIWRMNVDGSHHVQITNDKHSNWFPHPSPDGKYLVYLCYLNDQKEDHPFGQDVKLRLINLEINETRDLTEVFYGGQGTINVNSWSPDSKEFVFMSYVK